LGKAGDTWGCFIQGVGKTWERGRKDGKRAGARESQSRAEIEEHAGELGARREMSAGELGARRDRSAREKSERREWSTRGEDGPTCLPARTRSPVLPGEAAAAEPPPPPPPPPQKEPLPPPQEEPPPPPPLFPIRVRGNTDGLRFPRRLL